jgi:hypothetical protein
MDFLKEAKHGKNKYVAGFTLLSMIIDRYVIIKGANVLSYKHLIKQYMYLTLMIYLFETSAGFPLPMVLQFV